jgi:hypothetical protein
MKVCNMKGWKSFVLKNNLKKLQVSCGMKVINYCGKYFNLTLVEPFLHVIFKQK